MIFSSYPDWGKAPQQYIASIISQLAYYPDYVLTAMAHPATGLATKSMFLPVPAEVKAFADRVMADKADGDRYAQAQARRQNYLPRARAPFRPFPRLWEAFADEPAIIAILDRAAFFAFLDDAGRTLAVHGKDRAREFINPPVDSPTESLDRAASGT